ncbi:Retrovirus-related Pol poly from transposon opus [Paramuricea clavata]|uniref:Retrovirus-related Pol poly from transposon opus n=1 Tax=Paramuricea clavata TaxID=317549 RepID=A0A7D9IK16_PARCT|nr:Retrovirus-related Pol poly from transposon opus [Paramuricea clavata]
MAARAPKQWQLSKNETITSYESWRQNLIYILSLDSNFVSFLEATWQKKTSTNPHRGLVDDADPIPEPRRLTAVQKNARLDLLLGQIANFCPVVSRSSIVKNSVSLNDIWQKIRQHYGFQSTGAHFLDLATIIRQPDERPEDLYQRLMAFFEDNLLTAGGGITHHGEALEADEDLTPTLENTIVVLWLQLIHPGLPLLVKQKYGSELRNKSLASLKPEISQALSSLLDELRLIDETRTMRIGSTNPRRNPTSASDNPRRKAFRSCILCKTAGRPHTTHDLMDCRYLPERDRRPWARSRLLKDDYDDLHPEDCDTFDLSHEGVANAVLVDDSTAHRVSIVQSPVLRTFYNEHPIQLTLDTGATSNMVRASSATAYGFPVSPASQMARQADGVTPMDVVGEVHCSLIRGSSTFELDALVVRQLDVDILAGNPFLSKNDIAIRPAKREILIGGTDVVHYGQPAKSIPHSAARRTQSFLLRSPQHMVVLPGDYLQLTTPLESDPDALWALEPRLDSPSNLSQKLEAAWPQPQAIVSVDHTLRIPNTTSSPILIKKGEQLCQVRHIIPPFPTDPCASPSSTCRTVICPPVHSKPFSSTVVLDPDSPLPPHIRDQFRDLHLEYDDVFNPTISKYNGASGKIEVVVNMGPTLPPQRKGRLPQYNRSTMEALQAKFDELEASPNLNRLTFMLNT